MHFVHVRGDNREGTPPLVWLKAICAPGDEGEPVVTVMMRDDRSILLLPCCFGDGNNGNSGNSKEKHW
jgi:hypothetical protein